MNLKQKGSTEFPPCCPFLSMLSTIIFVVDAILKGDVGETCLRVLVHSMAFVETVGTGVPRNGDRLDSVSPVTAGRDVIQSGTLFADFEVLRLMFHNAVGVVVDAFR